MARVFNPKFQRVVPKRRYTPRIIYRKKTKKARLAPRVKRVVYSMAERKYFDTEMTGVSVDALSGGNWTLLNGIVQGTTNSTRIGAKIRITSIHYNVTCSFTASTSALGELFRCFLIVDKQTFGGSSTATPGSGTPSTTQVFTNTNPPNMLRNPLTMQRFRVIELMRENPTLVATGIGGGYFNSTGKIPMKGLEVQYFTNTTDAASIMKNAVWLLCVSTTGTSGSSKMSAGIRVFYTDA